MTNEIKIIGLGAGELDQLPLGIYKQLKEANEIYVRTNQHPIIQSLLAEGMICTSYDYIYENETRFEDVYTKIVDDLLEKAIRTNVIYAVPGHPMVAEQTVQLLLKLGPQKGIEIRIVGGQSFLDPLFTAIKMDPVEGFQLLDGTSLSADQIMIRQHIIITQVYDAMVASNIKLTLMEKYSDEYPVTIVTAAGTANESIQTVPLYELDREVTLDNLTSLYVPPTTTLKEEYREFSTLRRIIAELRGPNGCPWDIKQTHMSLKKYLIEEAYELLDAIDRDDIDNMIEELGDVLLQVMLHAQIGEDEGMFSIEDVVEGISEKMVRRHPHVFADTEVEDAEEVVTNWEQIKRKEKGGVHKSSILSEVAKGLPALIKAYEVQKLAAKVGFDWGDAKDAWKKVDEEIKEFEVELTNDDKQKQVNELGDLIFALINVSRLLNIHPEEALQKTNEKFMRRFKYIEERVLESGKEFAQYSLDELDHFWDEAKELEK